MCSGCGPSRCKEGADRCRRLLKVERLSCLIDGACDRIAAGTEERFETEAPRGGAEYGLLRQKRGACAKEEALARLAEFRRVAVGQLARMNMQRGMRAGEHSGTYLMRGKPGESGTGVAFWKPGETDQHVAEQIRATTDWT